MDSDLVVELIKSGSLSGALGFVFLLMRSSMRDAMELRVAAHESVVTANGKRISDLETDLAVERADRKAGEAALHEYRLLAAARIGVLEAAIRRVLVALPDVSGDAAAALDESSRAMLEFALQGET